MVYEKKLGIALLIIFVVLATLNTILGYLSLPNFLLSIALYSTTGLAAYFGFYYAAKIGLGNFAGKALFTLGISYGLAALAYIIWDFHVVIFGIEIPYPSVADIFWVISIPFLIIGLSTLLTTYWLRIRKRLIIESILAFLIIAAIIVYLIGWPDLTDTTLNIGLFNIIYTITDAILLAMAVTILRVAGGKIFMGLILFVIGLVLFVIGDITFAIRIESGTFYSGDIADITLLFAWLTHTAAVYYTAKNFVSSRIQT